MSLITSIPPTHKYTQIIPSTPQVLVATATSNACGLLKFGVVYLLTKPINLYTTTVYSVTTSKHVRHTTVASCFCTTSDLYLQLGIFQIAITLSLVLGRDDQLVCHPHLTITCSTVVLTCTLFGRFFLKIAKQQR